MVRHDSRPALFYPNLPLDEITTNDVDKIIASEMNSLSLQERERILEETHGVANEPDEPPDFVLERIEELEDIIRSMDLSESAYLEACEQSTNYVTNRNFRLMFLRAAQFDVHEAVERLILHFHFKKRIFGSEKLTRDILIGDIPPSDIKLVQEGFMDVLPNPDRAGRTVFVIRGFCNSIPLERMIPVLWYLMMLAAQDINNQKKGAVIVLYNTGGSIKFDHVFLRKTAMFQFAVPLRLAVRHACVYETKLVDGHDKLRYYLDRSCRLRTRCHTGNPTDIQRVLRGFGIPVASFEVPIDAESRMVHFSILWHMTRLYSEIASRRESLAMATSATAMATTSEVSGSTLNGAENVEINGGKTENKEIPNVQNGENSRAVILNPTPDDVLNGRGNVRRHPGNVKMHSIVEEYRIGYEHSSKSGKTEIVNHVVNLIKGSGGRFLRRAGLDISSGWEEIDESAAHQKVSKAFRGHLGKN